MNVRFVSEAELDEEFGVAAKLGSGGDYGCGCAVIDGDVVISGLAFEDHWWGDLNQRNTPHDVGTVLFNGNVTCAGASVSDRLMCLVITGNLVVEGTLAIFATETLVCGNVTVGELTDSDRYLTVLGTLTKRA